MCGVYVAEGWGVEEDGVPGGFGAARVGEAVESEIGGEPGGVDEVVERLQREIFDEVGREECGCGEDYDIRFELRVGGGDSEGADSFRWCERCGGPFDLCGRFRRRVREGGE